MKRSDILDALKEMGTAPGQTLNLAEAALLLAACERPATALTPYRRHLAALAEEVASAADAASGITSRVVALRDVFIHRFGYLGDTEDYDDLRNANLIDVIDRRRGLPVALGIILIHAVRCNGGRADGLNFPSHFFVRMEALGQRAIVDPFDGLRRMETPDLRRRLKELVDEDAEIRPEHYEAVSDRDVLVRLQNNIKLRALAAGDLRRTLHVLETLTAIAPQRVEFWWETALAHDRLGNTGSAIGVLESWLRRDDQGPHSARLKDLLRTLRNRSG